MLKPGPMYLGDSREQAARALLEIGRIVEDIADDKPVEIDPEKLVRQVTLLKAAARMLSQLEEQATELCAQDCTRRSQLVQVLGLSVPEGARLPDWDYLIEYIGDLRGHDRPRDPD